MRDRFYNYLKSEYQPGEERLLYLDIGEVSRHITIDYKKGETTYFSSFFEKVEEILQNCDDQVETLIAVGLFEDIQNILGKEINYYSGFNDWLKPISKSKWDSLIDFWEGIDWRNTKSM